MACEADGRAPEAQIASLRARTVVCEKFRNLTEEGGATILRPRRFTKDRELIGIGRCAYIQRGQATPAQVLFPRSGYVQQEWV